MRWSMLPVSVAVHSAALMCFMLAPFAAGLDDLPNPWPLATRYVAASAALPPIPVQRSHSVARTTAAPVRPPDRIAEEPIDPGPALSADGGWPDSGPVGSGLPDGGGLGIETPIVVPPPPPPVERPQVFRVGGDVREPRKIVDVPAVYPEIARQAKIEGVVVIEATIDEQGFVTGARVLRSRPPLDAAALAALKQWRYTPTRLNGVPVRVLMMMTFNFKLSDREP